MALKLDIIGQKTEPVRYDCDPDKVILYALGIGASVEKELDFLYEKALKVFPTFCVIPVIPAMGLLFLSCGLNLPAVLHGEQQITLHEPIPASGPLYTTAVISSIYDKGDKGAVINFDFETRNDEEQLIFENRIVLMDRSAGHFGGDRGPKSEKILPPEGVAPGFQVSFKTWMGQAALYRLSGDKNPIHVDPEFAKLGGLDRPILHGLCTFGIAGRAILHSVCGSDPARFKSFKSRFTGVVYPGETLITEGWKVADGTYVIQTKTQDGRIVLSNAEAKVA